MYRCRRALERAQISRISFHEALQMMALQTQGLVQTYMSMYLGTGVKYRWLLSIPCRQS